MITKKYAKYKPVHTCPKKIYGTSTCNCPKFINKAKLHKNNQQNNFDNGLNANPLTNDRSVTGKINRITKAPNIAITPNNLSGIDRKIAQKGNKYHSGTIEAGVDIGLASIQLSGSPKPFGLKNTNALKNNK